MFLRAACRTKVIPLQWDPLYLWWDSRVSNSQNILDAMLRPRTGASIAMHGERHGFRTRHPSSSHVSCHC